VAWIAAPRAHHGALGHAAHAVVGERLLDVVVILALVGLARSTSLGLGEAFSLDPLLRLGRVLERLVAITTIQHTILHLECALLQAKRSPDPGLALRAGFF